MFPQQVINLNFKIIQNYFLVNRLSMGEYSLQAQRQKWI